MTGSGADTREVLRFDSGAFAPEERFERYRRLYAVGADVTAIGPDVRARVAAWRLDRAILYDRALNDLQHARTRERVVQDGFDHFTLTMVLSGRHEIDLGEGLRTLPIGGAIIVDTSATSRNRTLDGHIVTVSMARDRLIAVAGRDDLHGHLLSPARAELLIDYTRALLGRISTLDAAMVEPATTALMALVAGAAALNQGAAQSSSAIRDALLIGRVRALVDAHLTDPDFGARDVIGSTDLSRATLYRSFQAHGGIAGYIRARRLETIRLALVDGEDRRSFADIAFAAGFASEAHASRLFQRRVGQRPGEYRMRMAEIGTAALPIRQMRAWQDEVR